MSTTTEFNSIPIMIEYGYQLPPLHTDSMGQLIIHHEMMLEALNDDMSAGIMEHRYDDYSLNRYIIVRILSIQEATVKALARKNSGWSIMKLEKKLYENMEKLLTAYIPPINIASKVYFIDLSRKLDPVNLDIIVDHIR
jgi:hypothetical protein